MNYKKTNKAQYNEDDNHPFHTKLSHRYRFRSFGKGGSVLILQP